MNKLPVGVHNHIFRFLSHTAADAIREIISEFHAFSSQHESTSQLHTFYIFSFWTRRSATRSRLWTTCTSDWGGGVRVGVDDSYFRPSLWRLYESQFLGYFLLNFKFNTNPIYRTTI